MARRHEADLSTRHGLVFEDAVLLSVESEAQRKGDIAERTGTKVGLIRSCKVGDMVVALGPDSVAPEARVVVEAKEEAGYDLAKARREIETARKNRGAQVGVFVFSKKTAAPGLDPVARYGSDILVVWDAQDANDPFLRAGFMIARALCVASAKEREAQAVDFTVIMKAINEIEKQSKLLDEVKTSTETILRATEKISERARKTQKSLEEQVEALNARVSDLRASLDGNESASEAKSDVEPSEEHEEPREDSIPF